MVGLHVYNGGVKMIGKVEIFVSIMLYHYGSDINVHVQHDMYKHFFIISSTHGHHNMTFITDHLLCVLKPLKVLCTDRALASEHLIHLTHQPVMDLRVLTDEGHSKGECVGSGLLT